MHAKIEIMLIKKVLLFLLCIITTPVYSAARLPAPCSCKSFTTFSGNTFVITKQTVQQVDNTRPYTTYYAITARPPISLKSCFLYKTATAEHIHTRDGPFFNNPANMAGGFENLKITTHPNVLGITIFVAAAATVYTQWGNIKQGFDHLRKKLLFIVAV